jgi:hypothetical protein
MRLMGTAGGAPAGASARTGSSMVSTKRRLAGDDLFRAQPGGEIVEHDGDRNPRALMHALPLQTPGSVLMRSRHMIVSRPPADGAARRPWKRSRAALGG